MSILVVGSVAYDTIKTPWGEAREVLGGSATYFTAAASFFAPVRTVAVTGHDFSCESLSFLEKRGVDLSGLQTLEGKTFRWSAVYSQDLNDRQTICTELNVFERFQPVLTEANCRTPFVFLANIDPDLQAHILTQIKGARLIMSNTIQLWIEAKRETFLRTLGQVDVLMINDSEAKMLTGESNLVRAGRSVLAFGPRAVIITKGEHGLLLLTGRSVFVLPAFPIEHVCDPTGAGDSFAGGFMGYMARSGRDDEGAFRKAAVYGSVMSTFAIESFSIERLKNINLNDIEERYEKFVEFSRFHDGG